MVVTSSYPIGTPGLPWGAAERASWLARQRKQRSYADQVQSAIERLRARFDVIEYGRIEYGDETYPLLALRSRDWRDDLPAVLVTGGVHGYETSGVHGALRFAEQHAADYVGRVNLLIAPCVSPWAYERVHRWNANAVDPNRSFRENSPAEESAALMRLVAPLRGRVLLHIDLHETTDTDESEFRPALAARDGKPFEPDTIPDGFYLVGDAENPQLEFQRAINAAVAKVTHIAPADEKGRIIGESVVAPGVILYAFRQLGLCAGLTDARYTTTTEVYPDSPRATPEQCDAAQAAAVCAAIDYALANAASHRVGPGGMSFADFDPLLARAHAHASDFLHDLPQRFIGARAGREEMMAALDAPLPQQGQDGAAVLDLLASQAPRGASACAAPRYFGFVIGGSLPVALAADWLVSTWDQNSGIHVISPLGAALEEVAARWLLDLFDLPRESGVGFVTGCQMAHFTCLAAARHGLLLKTGWDVEADGLAGAPRITVVASAEAHVTLDVALRYLGFGTRAVVRIEADAQGRMRADRLREVLPTLSGPILICAQAGNVNTGAFDPLREIGRLARAHGAWLHVDGAFGLWARASAAQRVLADGIELADSWATDAHKWLNVPYDCGVAIVRDASAHRAALMSSAAYLIQTRGPERDSTDWVPEFSRRARGIPTYAALRALGRDGVADLIERLCARARQFAQLLAAESGVSILNEVALNQVLVRFGDDDLTRQVVAGVQQDGTCWASGTTWHELAAMRISVSNWATSEDDVAQSAAAILRVFRELRPKAHA